MRPVYMLSGGITKFAKAHPDKDFRLMVKEAFDAALGDLGGRLTVRDIDGSVISYFSDHFTGQLKAGAMVQDFVGLCPKPNIRVEGGGATGGLCFQAAVQAVASGRHEVCAAMGFETMSTVETWKGNDFIALASDTHFDYPLGGFYTGYYAMMTARRSACSAPRRQRGGSATIRSASRASAAARIRCAWRTVRRATCRCFLTR